MPNPPPGVVLVDKPRGKTSHDVVAAVRRPLPRGVKVGHAGTLDPFATGLLLVLVGRATRAQRFFMTLPKTYRVVARLGWRSDTGDVEGVLSEGRVPSDPQIPVGSLMQRPPAHSAVKVGGEPLYRKARRGEGIEGEARAVVVWRAEPLWLSDGRAAFEVEVSSGTYVRQLVSALGDAYCEQLERVAVGPFRLADADPARVVPVARALVFLPERPLSPDEASKVVHGQRVPLVPPARALAPDSAPLGADPAPSGADPAPSGADATALGRVVTHMGAQSGPPARGAAVRLTHGNELVAIAEPRGSELQPVVVFAP